MSYPELQIYNNQVVIIWEMIYWLQCQTLRTWIKSPHIENQWTVWYVRWTIRQMLEQH